MITVRRGDLWTFEFTDLTNELGVLDDLANCVLRGAVRYMQGPLEAQWARVANGTSYTGGGLTIDNVGTPATPGDKAEASWTLEPADTIGVAPLTYRLELEVNRRGASLGAPASTAATTADERWITLSAGDYTSFARLERIIRLTSGASQGDYLIVALDAPNNRVLVDEVGGFTFPGTASGLTFTAHQNERLTPPAIDLVVVADANY